VTGINGVGDAPAQSATFVMCRSTAAVEDDCSDGLDNDCNGLVDAADPACRGVAPGRSPLPAPLPLPPRRGASSPPPPPPRFKALSPPPPPFQSPCLPPACVPAGTQCGDRTCHIKLGENNVNCPMDCCGHKCGDGVCNAYAEDCRSCPADCRGSDALGFCCGGAAPASCDDPRCNRVAVPASAPRGSCTHSCTWPF
jgi:hypothetical protein